MHAAIVTGVSRGLGAALAAALLARDFTVLGIGRSSHSDLGGARYTLVRFDLADAGRIDEALGPAFTDSPKSIRNRSASSTTRPLPVPWGHWASSHPPTWRLR
jgi:NAD(P)-dependent dehydrogenase (short-subunit alcohol dehydrogenase family)